MSTPEQAAGSQKYIKDYKAGSIFFFENEQGEEMYIIQQGAVSVTKRIQNVDKEIAVLKKGDFFGEMSLLLNEPRSATVKAKEDTTVVVINKDTFRQMLQDNTKITLKMVEGLADRIKQTDDRIKKIMEDRIFIALLTLIEDGALRGQKTEDGKLMLLETIEDLSRIIGLPIIKVDEVLKKLEKAGFLELRQNYVILKDWKAFMEFKKTYITRYKF